MKMAYWIGPWKYRRIPDEIEVGFICFANTGEYEGVLFESENAKELMKLWEK